MATLYWGGGTGTWDGFTTANWYTDVGRTTLSTRAPSAEDDVIFDSASSATAYTVTLGTPVCRNVTIAGPASGNLTFAGTGSWYVYGNLTLPATGFTRTFTAGFIFYGAGSHTITTNGVAMANTFAFLGTGTYTLQDALNNGTSAITLTSGIFNTNDKNLTCGAITSAPWSGTRLGNCLGNTGITFGAGTNKYIAAATASSNWSDTIWATSSGGSASAANFPLAQDTVIIDNAGLSTSATLTLNLPYNIGNFDTTSRTNAMTFAPGAVTIDPSCYGSTNISANVTITASSSFWTYAGRTTQNITTSGKNWGNVTGLGVPIVSD